MGRLFPQTINSQKDLGFLLPKPGCLFRMQPPGNPVSTFALLRSGNTQSRSDKGDINWSALLGKILTNEQARPSFPVGDPAHFPSQFAFGTDDNHNWQGRSDERIKLAVMTALHWDLAVPRDRVQVSVHRRWVTLPGRVSRDYERGRAEADALMCSGVAGVSNRVICEAGN
jgi:hypothetical protein